MATYSNKLNPIFSNFTPDLTQSLLVSVFGKITAKSFYSSDDPEEEIVGALYFIQNHFSKILLLDGLTGEILHTIPIQNPSKNEEELLRSFSPETMVGGAC
jgi:hypothetical protein